MPVNKGPSSLDLLIALQSLASFENYRDEHADDVEGIAEHFRALDPPLARRLCEVLHELDAENLRTGWCPPPPLLTAYRNIRAALDWIAENPEHGPVDVPDSVTELLEHGIPTRMTFSALELIPAPAARVEEKPPLSSLDWVNAGQHDVANARRFLDLHGADVRWCVPMKKWFLWDGTRWSPDGMESVKKLGMLTMVEFLKRAAAAGDTVAQKFAKSSLNNKEIRDFLELAKCLVPIDPSELDTHDKLVNFRNGTLNLDTMELQPHSRGDFITKLVHYDYSPEAQCPRFMEFLGRIMGSHPDASEDELEQVDRRIAWLQKAFGYSLTGVTSEKAVFICYGKGDTGKTTLLNTFRQLITEYATGIQIETLMTRTENSNSQADLADLRGARFAATSETQEGQCLDEAKIKRLSQGQGTLRVVRKYENQIEFPVTHKLWIDGNHKPKVRGSDDAIWERLYPILFEVVISKNEIDRKLPEKLLSEGAGILRWAVEGCRRWQSEELGRPDEVRLARNLWRKDSEVLKDFFDDCCRRDEDGLTSTTLLWQAYVAWCDQTKATDRVTRDQFNTRLEDLGFKRSETKHRFNGGNPERAWEGIVMQ